MTTALVACARFGLRAKYIGATGTDDNGRRIRRELAHHSVDCTDAIIKDARNQYAVIMVDEVTGRRCSPRRTRTPAGTPRPSPGSRTPPRTIPELYATLAGFYERERRWKEAADAYAQAIRESPRSAELKTQYVNALMNAGGRGLAHKARDVLCEMLVGEAERSARAVPAVAGRAAARRLRRRRGVRAASSSRRTAGARGATTRSRRRSKSGGSIRRSSTRSRRRSPTSSRAAARARRSTSACCCRTSASPIRSSASYDKAIATFEEAHRLAPNDRVDHRVSHRRRTSRPRNTRRRSTSRARRARRTRTTCGSRGSRRRRSGRPARPTRASSLLEDFVRQQPDDPSPTSRSRRSTSTPKRGAQAVKMLQDAQVKFPGGHDDRVRARRRARQAEAVRRRRGRVPAGAVDAIPSTRRRSTISATCSPSAASGSTNRSTPEEGAGRSSPTTARISTASAGRTSRPTSSISPSANLEARRRSAEDQLGHPGSLRRRALQARPLRRCDRGVERARSPATATRSIAPTSTRRSDPRSRSSARNDAALGGARCWRCPWCARRAARR